MANTLEKGLRAAIKDGSFDQLFLHFYGDVIQKANLRGRTKIVYNPVAPENLPRELLWRP